MKKYSIKEIEQLTGIKAHTLRIWEKRYNLLCHDRTHTNIRFYTDQELKRFMNIAMLIGTGLKISHIARLNHDELCSEVHRLSSGHGSEKIFVDRFIHAMIDMNESQFHIILGECVNKLGFINAMTKVVYPFLDKIGILWQTGSINPFQEHFILHLIRQKLLAETDKLDCSKCNGQRFILFLPVDERHEIGLLFYNYYLRYKGCQVIYLGQSVTTSDLEQVFKLWPADCVLTYFVSAKNSEYITAYLQKLESLFNGKNIFLSGTQVHQLNLVSMERCRQFMHFDDFKQLSGI